MRRYEIGFLRRRGRNERLQVGRQRIEFLPDRSAGTIRRAKFREIGDSYREARFLRAEVQGYVGLVPGRHPHVLAPFGNAPLFGGADGVLSFGQGGKPETALRIGFRGLEVAALGSLQSYSGFSDGIPLWVQHLAANGAEPCGRCRRAADG